MFPMFLINPKASCGIWCALVLCASGQDAAPNSGDLLESANTARLLEFEKNHNTGGPRRPMSAEMFAISRKPDLVRNLRAEDLVKMSLDDPLLKWAYACVFLRSMGPLEQLEPPQELALADMRRRGEAVSPMLLKLMSEHEENIIEDAILVKIAHLDTVRIEPFLEYARRLLRERTQTMTAYSAGSASSILGHHGTREDEALLEWVIKERPFVASVLTKALQNLRARLDPQPKVDPEPRPERREIPIGNSDSDARSAESVKDHPQEKASATSQAKPWLLGGMFLLLLLGVYRLLRKNPRKQP
jgi:hypothetical protein